MQQQSRSRRLVDRLAERMTAPRFERLLRFVPTLPDRRRSAPPAGPMGEVPPTLLTVPGIQRHPELEQQAYQSGPLRDWTRVYPLAAKWAKAKLWRGRLPQAPRMQRANARVAREPADGTGGARVSRVDDPAELTEQVRAFGLNIGLSAVGFAVADPRYTYAEYLDQAVGDRIVVCILEQDWARTQTIPSAQAEQEVQRTYAGAIQRACDVSEYLRAQGYAARAHGHVGPGIVIHYAVAAGLGQLGLNGQLLTPFAGSRCRIVLVETDAPLFADAPVDFGITGLCNACRACVRRCPVGAIPGTRGVHRGVEKIKIKTERCLPTVGQAEGCGICMKVCPVQRYGLGPVLEEFGRTGTVRGTGTDELEGYRWPLDGKWYGPTEKPRDAITGDFLHPDGLVMD